MSDKRMTAPVTDELLRELINTEQLLAQYTGDDAKINDRDHYGAAVLQLEALAKAVLFAQAAVSLMAPKTAGARFHTNSGAPLMKTLDGAIPYLYSDASHLMRYNGGALSKFKSNHVTNVVAMLSELYHRIVSDIRSVAAGDLATVAASSSASLVDLANVVARVASGEKPAFGTEGRCTVMMDGGYRCTKHAGHRPEGSDDPHTPN